ncbi:MAG: S8 family serine peptidase [Chloroflexi bacterium]|nr:S8 family serine peptidase [Ardenticatenaceae bacterium]MBL1128380.1 hypothetical protein [Chloroflexota bacterium]NOG34456.1 S8 family serine peptidase [Chloroflexota bacterium]GIK57656.1 MAG: hypothetical protein BroJett015_33190 [Chloroflexota bacterium]
MMRKVMKILLCLAFVALFTATVAAEPAPQADGSLVAAAGNGRVYNEAAGETEPAIYIIQLTGEPVATYTGGIAGLAATSPLATGAHKLDSKSQESLAYEQYLADKQNQFVSDMNNLLGRNVDISFYYRHAYNGVAAFLSPAEAAQVAGMNGVNLLYRESFEEILTDAGPAFIGAETIWNASGGNKGEGIIVGIIDTGINSGHPSFADVGGDGYDHTNPFGSGNYVGYCVANPGFCNDKLIGAWAFHPSSSDPEDADGHGSHTASTVAGNYLEDPVLYAPTANYTFASVSGVAPHANIIAYQVCVPSCPTSATTAAVNQAVIDGVDVTNYSISGGTNPYVETTAVAFRNAVAAGVFPANSAGNSGPTPGTVGHQGPWIMTVAASTHNRAVLNSVVDLNNSSGPLPDILGESAATGYGPATLVYAGDAPYNNPLCNPFPPGTFSGEIVVCDRGTIGRVEKGQNVLNAGGGGMILANNASSAASLNADTHVLPATHISYADGVALKAWMAAGTNDVGRITGGTVDYDAMYGDNMASFSSRGPAGGTVPGLANLIKPDVTAPGLNILAAFNAGFSTPPEFNIISGTSMSSPHAAGAAALIRAMHPTWTPAEVKSALMMTGITALEKEDNSTPTDPFDLGSGRVNLTAAGDVGFVLNITDAEYVAANPATGGDPKLLNLPSLANNNCAGTCTWTRTLRSVLTTDQEYNASVSGPTGVTGTVTPSNFTLAAGGTQVITIELDVTGAVLGSWAFAQVNIEPAPLAAPMVDLLNEQFSGATFPPAGWAVYKLAGTGTTTWIRDTAQSYSPPASARRIFGGSGDGNQDDWLVTPPLALDGSTLTYYDRGDWMGDYGYSGVWISTASCNPADGQFVELLETADILEDAWRATPVSINLSAYNGQTACLAFRYGGVFAHTWWIDDVVVTSGGGGGVPAAHMPIAVIPAQAPVGPVIDVSPDSLESLQAPDSVVVQQLTISNQGDQTLTWTIDEESPVFRGTDGGDNAVAAENAVGMQAGPVIINPLTGYRYPTGGVLYDNGPLVNCAGCGVGGADESVLQNVSLGMSTLGFGHQFSVGNRMADDFTVSDPEGWSIDSIDFFAYQSFAGPPSTITGVYFQIWDGPPNDAGSSVIFGDTTTNRMSSTTWANIYRVTETTTGANTDRPVMVSTATAGIWLAPGTYWLDWMSDGSAASGPWAPPVTITGQTTTGNALQFTGTWGPANDTGTSTQQDLPFILMGTVGGGGGGCTPSDIPWASVSPTSGSTSAGGSSTVDVTFDSTGLGAGTYTGDLCISSNDSTTPEVFVPLTLTVTSDLPDIVVAPASLSSSQPPDSTSSEDLTISNVGTADLTWTVTEAAGAGPLGGNWSDDFDSYATDSQIHGQGGWKGWFNDPGAGAFVRDTYAVSAPNSVEILGGSDLVHEYSGYTSGFWTYTAWQYVPTDFVGESYFIMLNQYNDAGTTMNWSTQVMFSSVGDMVINDGVSGGTLPLVKGEWVEIRVEIDLDNNTQTFYYDGQMLFAGTWTNEVSGGGIANIAAVDLFANGASAVYYDNISLMAPPPPPCDAPTDLPWLSVAPDNGTTVGGDSSTVTVTFDSTGLSAGDYTGLLCVDSNDPDTPRVEVPVTLTVLPAVYGVEVAAEDADLSGNVGTTVMYMVWITNTGNVEDTFDLTAVGIWDAAPSVPSVTLAAGASTSVMVHVDVPAGANDGDTDVTTFTATSQSAATATASVDLTTTAVVEIVDTNTYIYLPIILKP